MLILTVSNGNRRFPPSTRSASVKVRHWNAFCVNKWCEDAKFSPAPIHQGFPPKSGGGMGKRGSCPRWRGVLGSAWQGGDRVGLEMLGVRSGVAGAWVPPGLGSGAGLAPRLHQRQPPASRWVARGRTAAFLCLCFLFVLLSTHPAPREGPALLETKPSVRRRRRRKAARAPIVCPAAAATCEGTRVPRPPAPRRPPRGRGGSAPGRFVALGS